MLRYKLPLAGLVLACAGCVAVPPPAPPPPPAAVAAPQAAAEPQHCREFQQTVMVGGQPQQGYGTTCLQPDGSWQIVSPPTAGAPPASPPPAVAAAPYPAYPYPYYPYPYYAYPGYVGPPVSVGLGFRFHVH